MHLTTTRLRAIPSVLAVLIGGIAPPVNAEPGSSPPPTRSIGDEPTGGSPFAALGTPGASWRFSVKSTFVTLEETRNDRTYQGEGVMAVDSVRDVGAVKIVKLNTTVAPALPADPDWVFSWIGGGQCFAVTPDALFAIVCDADAPTLAQVLRNAPVASRKSTREVKVTNQGSELCSSSSDGGEDSYLTSKVCFSRTGPARVEESHSQYGGSRETRTELTFSRQAADPAAANGTTPPAPHAAAPDPGTPSKQSANPGDARLESFVAFAHRILQTLKANDKDGYLNLTPPTQREKRGADFDQARALLAQAGIDLSSAKPRRVKWSVEWEDQQGFGEVTFYIKGSAKEMRLELDDSMLTPDGWLTRGVKVMEP